MRSIDRHLTLVLSPFPFINKLPFAPKRSSPSNRAPPLNFPPLGDLESSGLLGKVCSGREFNGHAIVIVRSDKVLDEGLGIAGFGEINFRANSGKT